MGRRAAGRLTDFSASFHFLDESKKRVIIEALEEREWKVRSKSEG